MFKRINIRTKFRGLSDLLFQTSGKEELPKKRQLYEMACLLVFKGLSPNYYNNAGFASRQISWEIKKRYLNSKQYFKTVWKLNDPDYRKLSQNKMAEKAMFSLYNIPTSEYLGYLDGTNGRTPDGTSLCTVEDLGGYLEQRDGSRICFKLLEGWGGKGFKAVDISRQDGDISIKPLDGDAVGINEFCNDVLQYSKGTSYMLEAYCYQHPKISMLNPTSVNTIRMWVVNRPGDNPTRVIGAFLRLGRKGSLVDNTDAGGLLCNVELESGRLHSGTERSAGKKLYDRHPDTDADINGLEIPYWKQAKNLACKTLNTFPFINFAGVDIAITETEPIVIEMNIPPDPNGGVCFGYCRNDLLSTDPW